MKVALYAGIAALLGLSATAAAQEDEPSAAEMAAIDSSGRAIADGQYLKAAETLRPFALKADGTIGDSLAFQEWQQVESMITGEAARVAQTGPSDHSDRSAADRTAIEAAGMTDAIPAIVAHARDTRIVILNESHGTPRDRAFGLEVARALRPLGYDILAAEALSSFANPAAGANAAELIRLRGALVRDDGYYTRDPVFADFFRQAMAIGYRPIAYDVTKYDPKASPRASVASREQQEADNIIAMALTPYPHAKILIYVGYAHAAEAPIAFGEGGKMRLMAARLKQSTGIDPLTIDQASFAPVTAYGTTARNYALIAPRLRDRSVVLTAGSKPLVIGDYRGAVDLQVVHPPTQRIDGRPDWLAAMNRTPTAIPARLLPKRGSRLIQAFLAREGEDAIPIDQVLVSAGNPPPMLMLPAVPVRYAYQDGAAR